MGALQFSKVLFYIGNPLKAKPHYDLSVIKRFIKEQPEYAVVIVVDTPEEEKELQEKMKDLQLPEFHPGGFIIPWGNDAEMIDCFCADMHFIQLWKVVGPAWYECKGGHSVASTLKEPLEKCPECQAEVVFVQLDEAKCQRFAELLGKAVILMKFDTHSANVLSQQVSPTANVMKNMPYALGLPSAPALRIEAVSGSGKGKAAFCVSAGPSLKHAIPHLKRLQDQAVIIAVARVFRRLKAEGIRVDYILECEMFDWCSPITEMSKEEAGDTVLLYPPVCAPATVAAWPGKSMCVFDHPSATLLKRMPMTGGNSVSHHIYNFAAEILKCDKVILVGQDLAYTEPSGETHAEGTTPEKWPAEAKKEDANMQHEDWDIVTDQQVGPFYPDLHRVSVAVETGSMVPVGPTLVRTSPAYRCFRDLFDILIARAKVKTYNACPNGLKINNTKYLDLGTVTRLEDIPV